ncbi:MAG: glutaminyl-peptide cyclotransferase [Anaerolineae bacterium]|jgi:glutamine cyclotransferase|nr:glutaminyl-peptide cyclotransferase [Anaerolineae bacterium]
MLRRLFACLMLLVLWLPVVAQQPPVPVLVPEVLNVYPHDPAAFTQGLLFYNGLLYESTGLRGQSSLRQVDPETGTVLRQVDVRRTAAERASVPAPLEYFAEGLERVDERLIQLTWQENTAFVYDLATLEVVEQIAYTGEGWGLCYDGRYLFMSDSTQYLSLRDAATFDLIVRFLVTYGGNPIQPQLLNELECVGESIYANLWQTDYIVQIDKFTGAVTALIDAAGLLTEEERADLNSGQVLNGIAYNPATDTFFITGKQWPKLFEVRFVPAPAPAGD